MRRTLISAGAISALVLLGTAPAGAAGGDISSPVPLTSTSSAYPLTDRIVGTAGGYLIVNRTGNHTSVTLRIGMDGSDPTTIGAGDATVAVGDLVGFGADWVDVATGHTGTLPAADAGYAPHGGVRTTLRADGWHVIYDRFADPGDPQVDLGALPGTAGETFPPSLTSGPGQLLAWYRSRDGGAGPALYFSPDYTAGSLRQLDASSLHDPNRQLATCYDVIAAAAACGLYSDSGYVIARIPTNGDAETDVADYPQALVLTPDYTAWTSAGGGGYNLKHAAAGTTSTTTSAIHPDAPELATDGSALLFADGGTTSGSAGTYRLATPSATSEQLVAASPRAPLSATVPALGPGRAAWVDDSTRGYDVQSVTLAGGADGAPPAHGPVHDLGNLSRKMITTVAVSGVRTVWNAYPSLVRINNGSSTRTLGTSHGAIAAISGTRILFCDDDLYDLVAGTYTNLASRYGVGGAVSNGCTSGSTGDAALFGNYLAFGKADGSVWRTYLGATPVLLSPPRADSELQISLAGDWVAWTKVSGEDQTAPDESGYRNYRTMDPPVGTSQSVTAVSAAAYRAYDASRDGWDLRSWQTGAVLATMPRTTADHTFVTGLAVGQYVAASGPTGRPAAVTVTRHLPDRPRSLGNPFTSSTVRLYHRWHLDLVSSAALSSCSVRITRGSTLVRTLPCASVARAAGEVATSWTPGAVGAGHYNWTIVAGNSDGSMLSVGGFRVPTTGSLTITR